MLWVLVLVALVALSVYGAHRLLGSVDAFGSGFLAPALVYAAGVVVGCQATDAALNIHRVSRQELGLSSGDKTQAIVQVLSTHATDIAWQAGLLVAAAAILAATAGRAAPRT